MPIYQYHVAGDRGSSYFVRDDDDAAIASAQVMADNYRASVSVARTSGPMNAAVHLARVSPTKFRKVEA